MRRDARASTQSCERLRAHDPARASGPARYITPDGEQREVCDLCRARAESARLGRAPAAPDAQAARRAAGDARRGNRASGASPAASERARRGPRAPSSSADPSAARRRRPLTSRARPSATGPQAPRERPRERPSAGCAARSRASTSEHRRTSRADPLAGRASRRAVTTERLAQRGPDHRRLGALLVPVGGATRRRAGARPLRSAKGSSSTSSTRATGTGTRARRGRPSCSSPRGEQRRTSVSATRRLVVNVDGGARGNPGPAAIAAVVATPDGEVLEQRGERSAGRPTTSPSTGRCCSASSAPASSAPTRSSWSATPSWSCSRSRRVQGQGRGPEAASPRGPAGAARVRALVDPPRPPRAERGRRPARQRDARRRLDTRRPGRAALYSAARAAVAQLARASACHAEGRGFESHQPLASFGRSSSRFPLPSSQPPLPLRAPGGSAGPRSAASGALVATARRQAWCARGSRS